MVRNRERKIEKKKEAATKNKSLNLNNEILTRFHSKKVSIQSLVREKRKSVISKRKRSKDGERSSKTGKERLK